MNSASIFDLSPSEKLQLVEDLWDDLAAAPEAVPVHDWQKQELASRKANLLKNPASGLPWGEVKRNCVPAMPVELVIAPEAELDIAEAYVWYEGRRAGPG
jgi:putative addiction module component (TIGR02574 family)